MARSRLQRLVIDPSVPPHLAGQLGGLWEWFKAYAEENLPGEELAPGEDGLPSDSEPVLENVERVEQVQVSTAADIGRGHLSVKCSVRLTLAVSLDDPDDEPVSISPTWQLCLLVDPRAGRVLEHSHGWESDYLPDPS